MASIRNAIARTVNNIEKAMFLLKLGMLHQNISISVDVHLTSAEIYAHEENSDHEPYDEVYADSLIKLFHVSAKGVDDSRGRNIDCRIRHPKGSVSRES
jgi:hypothetical protein